MKIINTNCPNCAAPLEIEEDNSKMLCPYCNSTFIIDDQIKAKHYEEAGYNFELGRQRAREEFEQKYGPGNPYAQEPPKRKTWLWVLGWIFMFPVPISILVSRSKKLAVWLKAVIIIAAWVLYLAWIGSANQDDAQPAQAEQDSAPSTATQTDQAAITTFYPIFLYYYGG